MNPNKHKLMLTGFETVPQTGTVAQVVKVVAASIKKLILKPVTKFNTSSTLPPGDSCRGDSV